MRKGTERGVTWSGTPYSQKIGKIQCDEEKEERVLKDLRRKNVIKMTQASS